MTMLDEKPPGTGRSGGPEQGSSRVRWDEAETHTIHPTTFNISITPGNIGLIFGRPANAGANGDAPVVRLDTQILLSPLVAKRLSAHLKGLIRRYESKFGPISPNPQRQKDPDPLHAEVLKSAVASDSMIRMVQSLGPESAFEKSFKVSGGNILDNRFLMGMSLKTLGQEPGARIAKVCEHLGMPGRLVQVFDRHVARASYVYFAFEDSGSTRTYKVYLEFLEAINKEMELSPGPPSEALLHLGLKWDIGNPDKNVVTKYTWHPFIPADEIIDRAEDITGGDRRVDTDLADAVKSLVTLAREKIPDRDIQYLEVTEEGNPRRSFDINVYKAHLQLAELYPALSRLSYRYDVPEFKFHSFYSGIESKRFGHLAGGLDRSGNPFFTVYYGVEWVPGISGRFPGDA